MHYDLIFENPQTISKILQEKAPHVSIGAAGLVDILVLGGRKNIQIVTARKTDQMTLRHIM